MSITVEGNSYDMLNGSNSGISVAKKDDKHYSVTLAPEFFAPLNGGSHEVLFKVSDQDGGEANIPVLFWTQGISPIGNNFDLWYNTANFSGVAFDPAASSVAVKYCTAGGAWKQLSASTTSTANIYSATANDFAAGISYEYALFVNDSQVGNILSVVTPEGAQIPESDLENWTEKDGQIMCPTSTLLNTTWDTGNHATASIGAGNLTNPSNDVRPGSKGNKSAYMKSMKAAVMGIGKFAAGNLFVGKFVQISGMGGIVDFGKPFEFTARPKAVKFWMKSNCGVIDLEDKLKLEGEIDLTKIFICFSDRSEPYRVNTNDETTLFDPRTAPNVVALSYYESKTSVTEWTEITLPIEYKDNDTKPNFLVFTFTCSGYGDYFTGSTDSFMYVDDIELVY